MKKILWIVFDEKITFNVNWLEYLILKRIFSKKKYQTEKIILKGQKFNTIIIDEWGKLK